MIFHKASPRKRKQPYFQQAWFEMNDGSFWRKFSRRTLVFQIEIYSRQCFGKVPDDSFFVAFRSIFQGNHAGVEIATDAHIGLLQRSGLLLDAARLESHRWLCSGMVRH